MERADLDASRAALLLISQYGRKAAFLRVQLRAANLSEAGAASEAENWLRIATAIERLESD